MNAKAPLACHGWAMSQHEDSGVFGGVKRVLHGCDEAVRGLELLELAVTGVRIDSFADAAPLKDDNNCVDPPKSRGEWGTGPPAAATTSRQVVSADASLSRKGSGCVSASSAPSPSAPSTVNDNYNGESSSSGGKASLRPDVAAAVPIAVPGRFGRGFGRNPVLTPTAGGVHHDCRTFGCFRQAAGPSA